MKYTIQDLKDGKVSLRGGGDIDALRRIIKLAFPEDDSIPSGDSNHYFASKSKLLWCCGTTKNIPKVNPSDIILDWVPQYGEDVECSTNFSNFYVLGKFVAKHPINNNNIICLSTGEMDVYPQIRKKTEFLEVTMEQIAEKFGVDVKQLVITDEEY